MTMNEMRSELARAYANLNVINLSGRDNMAKLITAMEAVEGVACALVEQMAAEAEQEGEEDGA